MLCLAHTRGGGGTPKKILKESRVLWCILTSFTAEISWYFGYFHPEGVVSRSIPMEDTQYKLYFADMIHKSNHNGFINQTVC